MNKTVIITGGSTGIGKATARKFASEGYNVVISGRNEERGNHVAQEISKTGATCIFLKTDVQKEEEVINLIGKTVELFQHLDCIVNNAGISGDNSCFLAEGTTENFREVIETNVIGLFYCMKHAIHKMKDNEQGGSIVNLASIAGLNGIPYAVQYCASKHAVVGLTKGAAVEYATQGIRVNAIAPGAIKTDILQAAIDSGSYTEESIAETHPMKRMGTVEDIANGIFYLGSEQSPFMSGAILSVDGAYNAN
ncbi:SDR family NAD(P)-dependent oxidoreductase [Aquimarina spongiae]|uniref:NAD(P)-dependent dehydrogenase, short-chain alcohol dehydrogenase family n=1 Tax=Aquimarina spongiae TaxID=570521 RepID=A0A1M6HPH0_9FLAO|nr:SDR family NAD(P)-dependent oxidoreductase [Aquimarina spongiae]SHJ24036.1 NAD(P)-dependent dehydrogenase, short-chain alcohol dehydrogenase family [Aquimarina spongiae]